MASTDNTPRPAGYLDDVCFPAALGRRETATLVCVAGFGGPPDGPVGPDFKVSVVSSALPRPKILIQPGSAYVQKGTGDADEMYFVTLDEPLEIELEISQPTTGSAKTGYVWIEVLEDGWVIAQSETLPIVTGDRALLQIARVLWSVSGGAYALTVSADLREAFQLCGIQGETGPVGPTNELSVGTVRAQLPAAATITGTAPNQVLNLDLPYTDLSIGDVNTLPAGSEATADITGVFPDQKLDLGIPTGPANAISVGTVRAQLPAAATITGTAPDQVLNLDIPYSDLTIGSVTTLPPGSPATAGITGAFPNQALNLGLPAGQTGSGGGEAYYWKHIETVNGSANDGTAFTDAREHELYSVAAGIGFLGSSRSQDGGGEISGVYPDQVMSFAGAPGLGSSIIEVGLTKAQYEAELSEPGSVFVIASPDTGGVMLKAGPPGALVDRAGLPSSTVNKIQYSSPGSKGLTIRPTAVGAGNGTVALTDFIFVEITRAESGSWVYSMLDSPASPGDYPGHPAFPGLPPASPKILLKGDLLAPGSPAPSYRAPVGRTGGSSAGRSTAPGNTGGGMRAAEQGARSANFRQMFLLVPVGS